MLDSTLLTDGGLLALASLAASLEEVCILDNPNVSRVRMLPAPFIIQISRTHAEPAAQFFLLRCWLLTALTRVWLHLGCKPAVWGR